MSLLTRPYPPITWENSAIQYTVDTIDKWNYLPKEQVFQREILARAAAIGLVAAAIFDFLLHVGAAVGSLPMAVVKLVVDGLPIRGLDSIRIKLLGYNELRDVGYHLYVATKCLAEPLIALIGLVRPSQAVALNDRIGLHGYKPQKERNRIVSFIGRHPYALLGLGALAAIIWKADLLNLGREALTSSNSSSSATEAQQQSATATPLQNVLHAEGNKLQDGNNPAERLHHHQKETQNQ